MDGAARWRVDASCPRSSLSTHRRTPASFRAPIGYRRRDMTARRRLLAAALGAALAPFVATAQPATPRWWLSEPIRFLQTNLSERDSVVDPAALVAAVDAIGANTLLVNMGGIVAQYPTRAPFHYPSVFLPAGRDLFGEALQQAHARRIRVVGRFDLSKTQKAVYDAHPEWFFRRASGEPAIYNGLYSTCINGDYYRRHALAILTEALERYEVDGLFFNMFGNPSADYSGAAMGPCTCEACRTRFRARTGREIPAQADTEYRAFLADSAREVAATIADLIHAKRPQAAFLTYIADHTDGIMSESNTAVGRPLPLWPYSASDNVRRALGSEPGKVAINLSMAFVDFPWRYAHVAAPEMQLRLYQNMAHGGPPAIAVVGTMAQADRTALAAARPVFAWHRAHEDLYIGQHNAARVLLLATGETAAYRGFFRLLAEQHVPFEVATHTGPITADPDRFDLVIVPGAMPAALDAYVRRGGRVLVAGTTPPTPLPIGRVVGPAKTQGYWRIHDHARLPSLAATDLLFVDGDYVELAPIDPPILTLIPTAMFGPPEKVWSDKTETTVPGLVVASHGAGRAAYLPWDVGGLYYRHSSPPHAALVADVINQLLPKGRQLRTSAHPLVEMTLMAQPARDRTLLHLVNGSGHHDTAYFAPIPMRDIRLELPGAVRRVRAVAAGRDLAITSAGGASVVTLPRLDAYEVLTIER
jgi:hypothetical protein